MMDTGVREPVAMTGGVWTAVRGVKIHDIETLVNCFVYCDVDRDSGQEKVFVIWKHRNDLPALVAYLSERHKLVGYNNLAFDAQVLQHILEHAEEWATRSADEITGLIYAFVQQLISITNRGGFPPVPEWKLSNAHLDLFKIWHFDNPNRFTRLKDLQVAMQWPNVQDMPMAHHTPVYTWKEVECIISYCKNDIHSTHAFYRRSHKQVTLRRELSAFYGLNLLNANDTRIGAEIFARLISDKTGISLKELKKLRSPRTEVHLGNLLLPIIRFEDPDLVRLQEIITQTTITDTADAFKHQLRLGDIVYDVGLGGIHACAPAGRYQATAGRVIRDMDVRSFYPSLAISHGLYPEHLGPVFCDIYREIFEQRLQIPKSDPRNLAYKFILNGVYGKSNDKDSFLYDPRFMLQITVNGQLLILMLAERLLKVGCQVLQANTDGITISYDGAIAPRVQVICEEWQQLTGLVLEHSLYREMIIRDVHNYIGLLLDGTQAPKCKGVFERMAPDDPDFAAWHKDPSYPIIAQAIFRYFTAGVPVEKTIMECTDIYQFCGRAKFKADAHGETWTLDLDHATYTAERQQKTTRYYVSTTGAPFFKVYASGKQEAICKGHHVIIFNNYIEQPFATYQVDYRFYIKQSRKIIETIEQRQCKRQLHLF